MGAFRVQGLHLVSVPAEEDDPVDDFPIRTDPPHEAEAVAEKPVLGNLREGEEGDVGAAFPGGLPEGRTEGREQGAQDRKGEEEGRQGPEEAPPPGFDRSSRALFRNVQRRSPLRGGREGSGAGGADAPRRRARGRVPRHRGSPL